MKKSTHLLSLLALALALVTGCPPSEPETATQTSTGSEEEQSTDWNLGPLPDVEEEQSQTGDTGGGDTEQPPPRGPAQLTVNITVNGRATPGPVKVMGSGDEVVAEGNSGDTFEVPAGEYLLWGHVTDASVAVDTPERTSDRVLIAEGERRTEAVEFGVARVRLRITRNGRAVGSGRVELRRSGESEVYQSVPIGNDYVNISAGRYDATIVTGADRIDVTDLVFMEGATRDMQIPIS